MTLRVWLFGFEHGSGQHPLRTQQHLPQWLRATRRAMLAVSTLLLGMTPLGLPQPHFVITAALQRGRILVRRLLRGHRCRPPPCVIELILDHLVNDVGDVAASRRWACVLMRSRVWD